MRHVVFVQGAVGWIEPPPEQAEAAALTRQMTYFDPDGPLNFQYLYNADAASFHAGFCTRVRRVLEERGNEVTMRVCLPPRTVGNVYGGLGPDDPLPLQQGVNLYESQREALPELFRWRYGIIWAAIGFGKTHVGAAAIAGFNRPGFVLCQRTEEVKQGGARLAEVLPGVDIGEWSGRRKRLGHVTVATMQSLLSAYRNDTHPELREAWEGVRTVLVDECHRICSPGHQRLLQAAAGTTARIGLTATAEWGDGRDLLIEAQIGAPHFRSKLPALVKEGRAVPTRCIVVHLPRKKYLQRKQVIEKAQRLMEHHGRMTLPEACEAVVRNLPEGVGYAEEFNDILEDYVVQNPTREREVVRWCVDAQRRSMSTVVIVDRIKHGERLLRAITGALPGVEVRWLHGASGERERKSTLDGLRSRRVPVVVTTLMNQAIDVPTLDSLVLATAGRSAVQLVQRMRMTRAAPGKHLSYLVMFWDHAPALDKQSRERMRVLQGLGTFTFEQRRVEK